MIITFENTVVENTVVEVKTVVSIISST